MTKELELIINLIIEFDELGFEPTTLCDTKKEVDSFRNRLMKIRDYLKSIDNANSSEALKDLKDLRDYLLRDRVNISSTKYYNTIQQALIKAQEQEEVLNILKKKTVLLYSERRKIALEYEEWCKINNVMISDTTNMITWFLSHKLRKWLEDESVKV